MQKQAVIFADQDTDEQKPAKEGSKITISRDQYRDIVKEAYQEGIQDAKEKKQGKKKSPSQDLASSRKEARQEAIKAEAKDLETNKQKFEAIVARQDIELFRAKSVFPFALFPDTVIIDTTKISISKKQLFATEYISTIPLKDLSDVNVQTVMFLANLGIKYMPQASSPGMNEAISVNIANMKRDDAIKAKNILKGALVAKAEEIDIAKLEPEDVRDILEKFGHSEGVD